MANLERKQTKLVALGTTDSRPGCNQIRIGCAGWSIPREAACYFGTEGTHLERYAQVLNCCEINSSFYRPHRQATWERWSDSVPGGFKFAVKMSKTITHEAALNCNSETLAAFLQQTSFLHEKLGALLIQLPPSLEFKQDRVRVFLSRLRDLYAGDVACEPRHSTWFSERADEVLREFHITRAAADPACVPAAAQPGGYAAFLYFRLHGSPRRYYPAYPKVSLDRIAGQLASLARKARVWCVFDNTAAGYAIQNALQLAARLKVK
jgi:uncharacterized protein YecE (DUF72 family)